MCPKNISEAALFYDRFWSENDFFFSDHLHAKVAVKYLLRFDTTPPHFMLITKSSASVPQEFCVCVDKPIKSHSQLKLGWVVLWLSWFLSQAILRISNIRSDIYMVCMLYNRRTFFYLINFNLKLICGSPCSTFFKIILIFHFVEKFCQKFTKDNWVNVLC